MKRNIKPEILFIIGFVSLKFIPPLVSIDVLSGILGFTCMLVLLLGAAGITQRHRVSLIIFLLGFAVMSISLLFEKVFDKMFLQWNMVGGFGGFAILLAVIISWVLSLVKNRRKK